MSNLSKEELLGFYELRMNQYLKFNDPGEPDLKKSVAELKILHNRQSAAPESYLVWQGKDNIPVFLGKLKKVGQDCKDFDYQEYQLLYTLFLHLLGNLTQLP
ncbi:unnamed protein product [marine sediment metagenome]|uniref:Uncharacterized protein n=1 Tax=marine sediment metagenome TaxID=412755 RepID=X1G6Q5_9ZZZZ